MPAADAPAPQNKPGIPLEIVPCGRPTPLYVLGDRHALSFADLAFEERQILRQRFICQSHWISEFERATQELTALDAQSLFPAVQRVLRLQHLLDSEGQASHLAHSAQAQLFEQARERGRSDPLLIFCLGDRALHSELVTFLATESQRPESQHIDSHNSLPAKGQALLEHISQPFVSVLQQLQGLGFERLFIQALPPPGLDEEAYSTEYGSKASTALRYWAVRCFNQYWAQLCQSLGLGFLENWEPLLQDGRRKAHYALNALQLNPAGCLLSLQALCFQLSTSYRRANRPQYARCLQAARTQRPARRIQAALSQKYRQEHLLCFPSLMPQEQVARVRSGLNFAHGTSNREHYRLDWVGNPVSPYSPDIQVARPDAEILREVYQLVYFTELRGIIESCLGTAFTVPCCRCFKSLPTVQGRGPQVYHRDNLPPGALRALIYLTDVGAESGPFEYQLPNSEKTEAVQVTGPAGTVLVFDADAITHRGSPPAQGTREVLDLVILPAVAGIEQHVIWPGLNHWPVDPLHYSLHGYVSWPQFQLEHLRPQHPPSYQRRQALRLLQQLQDTPQSLLQSPLSLSKVPQLQLTGLPLSQLVGVARQAMQAVGPRGLQRWLQLSRELIWQAQIDCAGLLAESLQAASTPSAWEEQRAPQAAHRLQGEIIYLDGLYAEHAEELLKQFSTACVLQIISPRTLNLQPPARWQISCGGIEALARTLVQARSEYHVEYSNLQFWGPSLTEQCEAFMVAQLYGLSCTLPEASTDA